MKKIQMIIFFIIIIATSLFIGSFLGFRVSNNKSLNNTPKIVTVESPTCQIDDYIGFSDYNIYTYCIEHILLVKSGNLVELKNNLRNQENYINNMINNLKLVDTIPEKAEIYVDEDNYSSNGLKLIKCNTPKGNKDIYIGPKDMEYQESFCQNKDTSLKTFTRTYEVLNVTPSNSDEFIYITIRQFQYEEVKTYKIAKNLNYDIIPNSYYEFTFQYTIESIVDNLDSIFNTATLISVTKTDKIGLDQIQDPII